MEILLSSSTDDKALLDRIKTADYMPKIQNSYISKDAPYKKSVDTAINPLKQMSYAFPALLFILTILVLYLFLYQLVMEQKKEIGIFRALGASYRSIISLYMMFALIVSIIAVILGVGSGMVLTECENLVAL